MQLKHFVEKFRQYSNGLDNYAILSDQPWVTRTENANERCVFIFRQKENELLIAVNGKVEIGRWDYIASMKSLIIKTGNTTTLYNQGFLDDSVMILKVDGTEDYQLFVNENRITSTVEKLLKEVEKRYLQENKNKEITENKSGTENNPRSYISPEYSISKRSIENSFFGTVKEKITVVYEDNCSGEIYLKGKNKEAFFRGKPEGKWVSFNFLYTDLNCCINGLHYFLTKRKTLKNGFIKMF